MNILQRRRALMDTAEFWIYKNGITTDGYSFAGAGNYGGVNGGTFSNSGGELKCYVYDNTEDTHGNACIETTGLSREFISKYRRICFSAARVPGTETASVIYQHVGVYLSATPTSSNGIAVETPPHDKYSTVSIDIAALLNNNSNAEKFYIGAGVLTNSYKMYGKVYVSIQSIWLE